MISKLKPQKEQRPSFKLTLVFMRREVLLYDYQKWKKKGKIDEKEKKKR